MIRRLAPLAIAVRHYNRHATNHPAKLLEKSQMSLYATAQVSTAGDTRVYD
jgi:hypothetical protein